MLTYIPAPSRKHPMMQRTFLNLVALLLGLLWLTSPVSAAVILVKPGGNDTNDGLSWNTAKRTVGAGLKAAKDGDQVWVAAGTYVERTTLKKAVALYGGLAGNEDPATFNLNERDIVNNKTVLDGNNSGSVVIGPAGATATCRIDGFTITHGRYSGIDLHASSPTIKNNTIVDNYTEYNGAGLNLESSSAIIVNNTIMDNLAGNRGGGLYLGSSSPTIENNTIAYNDAEYGGGSYLYASHATIANNVITQNSAFYAGGGGLYLVASSPTVTNNMITSNYAAHSGGGLSAFKSSPTIANNTITGNSAATYDSGGGLYLSASDSTIVNNTITANSAGFGAGIAVDSSSPTIVGNTIVHNSADYQGGGLYLDSSSLTIADTIVAFNSSGIYRSGGDALTLRYNSVYSNNAYNYSGVTDPTGTDGNISADPIFVDSANGDFHLSAGSPCIDAGDNTSVPNGIATDLGGLPRFVDDPNTPDTGNGAPPIVDIGAYEFQARRGDLNCDGAVDFNDIDPFVTALISKSDYSTQHPDCIYLNADVNRDGLVDLNDVDGFVECLIKDGCE